MVMLPLRIEAFYALREDPDNVFPSAPLHHQAERWGKQGQN